MLVTTAATGHCSPLPTSILIPSGVLLTDVWPWCPLQPYPSSPWKMLGERGVSDARARKLQQQLPDVGTFWCPPYYSHHWLSLREAISNPKFDNEKSRGCRRGVVLLPGCCHYSHLSLQQWQGKEPGLQTTGCRSRDVVGNSEFRTQIKHHKGGMVCLLNVIHELQRKLVTSTFLHSGTCKIWADTQNLPNSSPPAPPAAMKSKHKLLCQYTLCNQVFKLKVIKE